MEAANHIAEFIADESYESFENNELVKSATLQKLVLIGEAAARVSKELKEKYPEIEWQDIVAFRNIAVHEYFAVSWKITWDTAVKDIPELNRAISGALAKEFPE